MHFVVNWLSMLQVALVLSLDDHLSRGVLGGIRRYAKLAKSGPWNCLLCPPDGPAWVVGRVQGELDAVIGRGWDPWPWEQPPPRMVTVTNAGREMGFPSAYSDQRLAGAAAAEDLLQRKLEYFASFVDLSPYQAGQRIFQEGFVQTLAKQGHQVDRFHDGPRTRSGWTLSGQIRDLADWLLGLPKPLGVATGNDEHGWRLLNACRVAGLEVPQQVSVVSYGNDPIVCEFCNPPLSSVAVNYDRIGYEAARILDQLLIDPDHPPDNQAVPPEGVQARRSSDFIAVDDPLVARALYHIRERRGLLTHTELLRHLHVSQSKLYRRFDAALGRSPSDEIRAMRNATIRELLLSTDLPLIDIALEVGFEHASQLSREVRHAFGVSPTQLRRQHLLH